MILLYEKSKKFYINKKNNGLAPNVFLELSNINICTCWEQGKISANFAAHL